MSQIQTVTINGRAYNALTGMPIEQSSAGSQDSPVSATSFAPQSRTQSQNAAKIHSRTQRSQTLSRRLTKKPEAIVQAAEAAPVPVNERVRQTVAKSPAITKFAPDPQPIAKSQPVVRRTPTIMPRRTAAPGVIHADVVKTPRLNLNLQTATRRKAQNHPAVAKVKTPAPATVKQAISKPAHPPAREIKNSMIEQALKNAPDKKQQKAPKKKSFFARHPRLLSIGSASLALVLLGGYFTYLNLPDLSVRVAAAQAGINASYPEYQPDGYRLNGPVAANSGKVEIQFASNAGPQGFTITQEKSSWDSSAVVSNIVKPKSNDSYVTTSERGLTIYTYNGNAAWVNKGILYTIEGDAPLSSEQIRRIASSL